MKYKINDKIKQQNIQRLDVLNEGRIKALNDDGIYIIGELCERNSMDLRNIGFDNATIKKINIELQLLGLNGIKGSL